jgi:hypothetical protein
MSAPDGGTGGDAPAAAEAKHDAISGATTNQGDERIEDKSRRPMIPSPFTVVDGVSLCCFRVVSSQALPGQATSIGWNSITPDLVFLVSGELPAPLQTT